MESAQPVESTKSTIGRRPVRLRLQHPLPERTASSLRIGDSRSPIALSESDAGDSADVSCAADVEAFSKRDLVWLVQHMQCSVFQGGACVSCHLQRRNGASCEFLGNPIYFWPLICVRETLQHILEAPQAPSHSEIYHRL